MNRIEGLFNTYVLLSASAACDVRISPSVNLTLQPSSSVMRPSCLLRGLRSFQFVDHLMHRYERHTGSKTIIDDTQVFDLLRLSVGPAKHHLILSRKVALIGNFGKFKDRRNVSCKAICLTRFLPSAPFHFPREQQRALNLSRGL